MINQLKQANFAPSFLPHLQKDYKAMSERILTEKESKSSLPGYK